MIIRRWVRVCSLTELEPGRGVAALIDGEQVALFLLPGTEKGGQPRLRAVDNRDPVSGANVLARGLIGSVNDIDFVASPMHRHRFDLETGRALDGESPSVRVWPVRAWGRTVEVLSVHDRPASIATHCPYCAMQCGMRMEGTEIRARPDFTVNNGRMCVKGWSAAALLDHPERMTQPIVAGEPASWDEALSYLTVKLSTVRRTYGNDAVGVFGSGALTNEKAYLLGKFARVALGTANIDYNGRFCMSSAAAAGDRAFGVDRGLPFPVSDIAGTDALLLWGSNPADTMPPLMQWVEAMRASGGRLIVVDPRRTETAALADIHLQPRPGTDLAVALGLIHLAIAEDMVDHGYLEQRTTGWEEVAASVEAWTPDRVQAVSGIDGSLLRVAIGYLGRVPKSMAITGRGPEQQSKGVDTVSAVINLMLALGQVGRANAGYGCLTGQGNGQGGREHGQKADQLPGYRRIDDPADRAAVADVWGVDPATLPGRGMSATEMLDRIGAPGGIRALIVVGSDLAIAGPGSGRIGEQLQQLDCLAVLDSMPTETARRADVVLPVTQWAEEDGTMTNLEGRVLRRRRAVEPPAGVRSDIDVLCDLAGRLGAAGGFGFDGPEAVFDELRRATKGARADYSGITYERLDGPDAIHWPCPGEDHPGTPRLFADRFPTPDGRARMAVVHWRPAGEAPDDEYPIAFTTGRNREHYNSGNQTRRVAKLHDARPAPRLELHPDLAAELGVRAGAPVEVESRRGRATFEATVVEGIRPDTVFAPFHWNGEGAANLLTSTAVDPISKMPEFKVCAVRLRPL